MRNFYIHGPCLIYCILVIPALKEYMLLLKKEMIMHRGHVCPSKARPKLWPSPSLKTWLLSSVWLAFCQESFHQGYLEELLLALGRFLKIPIKGALYPVSGTQRQLLKPSDNIPPTCAPCCLPPTLLVFMESPRGPTSLHWPSLLRALAQSLLLKQVFTLVFVSSSWNRCLSR